MSNIQLLLHLLSGYHLNRDELERAEQLLNSLQKELKSRLK